jgi:hypothetical protein
MRVNKNNNFLKNRILNYTLIIAIKNVVIKSVDLMKFIKYVKTIKYLYKFQLI